MRSLSAVRLKEWRLRQGLKQRPAAERLTLSQATVSDLEAGKQMPSIETGLLLEKLTDGDVPVAGWAQPAEPDHA